MTFDVALKNPGSNFNIFLGDPAITIYWRGTTNSRWSVASNWEPAQIPTENDTVIFDGSSPSCSADQIIFVDSLVVEETFVNTISNLDTLIVSNNLDILGGNIAGLNGNTWTISGNFSASVDLIATATWYLNVSGVGTITSTVAYANATGGSEINGTSATDGGNNFGINFGVVAFSTNARFFAFF